MNLTTEALRRFVGGQIEVHNQGEGYVYRGEISTAVVANKEFRATCAWLAKDVGLERWVNDTQLSYVASLEIYTVSDIGPGMEGGSRLCLESGIVGELVILHPPDGSKLDRTKVEGLEPVSA